MRKNCGTIAEKRNALIKQFIERTSLKAYAEENEGNDTPEDEDDKSEQTKPSTINYEDLIAKARREEKEKQYNTIEKLKGQIEVHVKQHNKDLLAIAELESQVVEAENKLTQANKGDGEDVKVLKDTISTLTKEKDELAKQVKGFEDTKPINREDIVAEVRTELEAEYEVKSYRVTKMAELKDDILVPELVMGTTKEEIDATIKTALERSNEIRKSLGAVGKPTKRTPKSPANPSIGGAQDNEVSLEYLSTLDVRSKEYADVRKQLGLK